MYRVTEKIHAWNVNLSQGVSIEQKIFENKGMYQWQQTQPSHETFRAAFKALAKAQEDQVCYASPSVV